MIDLKVLFLAAEAEPFIKVGGLGDVAGALPQALRRLFPPGLGAGGVDVRLVIPMHGAISLGEYNARPLATFAIPHANGPIQAEVVECEQEGVPVYLIGASLISEDDAIYHNDATLDGPKYAFFSLAALELTRNLGWKPHILHANDWHTALSVYAVHLQRNRDNFFQGTSAILGVHNLPYLGIGAEEALPGFNLTPATGSRLPGWAQNMPLPLGLFAADGIVAPSPTYAREILTPEFGSGLEDFLRSRQDVIYGILNGINTDQWDPQNDRAIRVNYGADDLGARQANKAALAKELDLDPDPRLPLVAMITRMDPQKGVDLVPDALRQTADIPWQAVLLGTGQPYLEIEASALQIELPDRVRTLIRYDAALSRRLYAGADILLMPSRYEPCGLNQMIAMRYGCVPLARSVGGLCDTVYDYDQSRTSTGFLFIEAKPEALSGALRRALQVYANQQSWRGLQQRGMQQDFSWERSARQYRDLYRRLVHSSPPIHS